MENMEIFGVVMLFALAIGLQHLCNYLIRKEESDLLFLGFICFVISIALFFGASIYIYEIK